MQVFQSGQKSKLEALMSGISSQPLILRIKIGGTAHECNVMLLGLDAENKMGDDRYTVFHNQLRSSEDALVMQSDVNNEKVFFIDLQRLPHLIRRLNLAVAVQKGDFQAVDNIEITLSVGSKDVNPLVKYSITGREFQKQRAIMLFDVYFKDVWRVGAVGQGFDGGLDALIRHFGGTENDVKRLSAPSIKSPTVQKITLEKQGQSTRISLNKSSDQDFIHINLNWDRGGSVLRAPSDLDLGCMYVLNDGHRGVIQALGGHFGAKHAHPFIMLDGDDRTGDVNKGENITIFRPDLIHTVLIFAFIYEGTNNFTHVNAHLTMCDTRKNEVAVRLNNPDIHHTFCGIALVENYGGEIKITKEERYFDNHSNCDKHYGFGFKWEAGSKS